MTDSEMPWYTQFYGRDYLDALGPGLGGVLDLDAQLAPIPQDPLESRLVVGGRDDQNLANTRQHQRRERMVDHRLVVDGKQLLADPARDRMKPSSRSACKNDSASLGHRGGSYASASLLAAQRLQSGRNLHGKSLIGNRLKQICPPDLLKQNQRR